MTTSRSKSTVPTAWIDLLDPNDNQEAIVDSKDEENTYRDSSPSPPPSLCYLTFYDIVIKPRTSRS